MVKRIIRSIRSILFHIKENCYCNFFHDKHKCYPDVGGKGMEGGWHCRKCHPCGEFFDIAFKMMDKEKVRVKKAERKEAKKERKI